MVCWSVFVKEPLALDDTGGHSPVNAVLCLEELYLKTLAQKVSILKSCVSRTVSAHTCRPRRWKLNSQKCFLGASQVALVIKNLPSNAGERRDMGLILGSGRCLGEGNGNLLQYSCLDYLMDKGTWWATAREVAKSQTHLRDWTCLHASSANEMWSPACLSEKRLSDPTKPSTNISTAFQVSAYMFLCCRFNLGILCHWDTSAKLSAGNLPLLWLV